MRESFKDLPYRRGMCSLSLFTFIALFTPALSYGPTFGTGIAGFPICAAPTTILSYTLPPNATHAVLHHFWVTGAPLKTDRMIVDYFIDGEATPSISFQPSLMCGLAFPSEIAHDYEYSAGGLCGKTAPVGGYSNIFPIPFYASVIVTVRANPLDLDGGGCFGGYVSVRGTVELPLVVPGSGRPLPLGTRLVVQSSGPALRQPLEFVVVAALPAGMRGELFQTTWAVEAQPVGGPASGGGYIEGCWNLHGTAAEPYPGLVVGTGVEDYFDSGYCAFMHRARRPHSSFLNARAAFAHSLPTTPHAPPPPFSPPLVQTDFGADSGDLVGILFANALSGLTLFQREPPFERLSAYRFHNTDPLVLSDGGFLTWQVGAEGHPGATKCGNPAPHAPLGIHWGGSGFNSSRATSPVNVTTSAWLFVFPGPFYCDNSTVEPVCLRAPSNASGSSWRPDCCAPPPPAPPGPAPPATPTPVPGPPSVVGCASGLCNMLCDNAGVHGCAASGWAAAGIDLRAPPSGKPCGGPLGPCATSPADACAPGWQLCLADATSDSGALARFRSNLSATACAAAGENVAYVAAMSHARAAWQGHCPPTPAADDNGCAAEGWGAEPVCCGGGCTLPSCPNAVWSDGTLIHIDENNGCGSLKQGTVDGVLCCKV